MYNHYAMSRKLVFLLLALCWFCPAHAQKKPVTIQAITGGQRTGVPGQAIWAPDGRRFAYEQDRNVYLYDVPSRTRRLLVSLASLESTATTAPKSETFAWQNRGVVEQEIQWAQDGSALLLSAGGDLFWFRFGEGSWSQLTATPEVEADPKLSPDGLRVSFRRANDLYVLDISSKQVTRLTRDGSATLWNARLDWVYPEELDLATAHWWSPDSKQIAYLQFDVSREPLYPHADLLPLRPVYEPQRYPKAGDPNADVRLGVVSATGGETKWMDLGETRDALLARVRWIPDSSGLFVQRLNRVQNRLDLLHAITATGASRLVLREEDRYWVNVADILEFLGKGAEFLWSSERDGFRHLYRYSLDGRQLARLTAGEWEVTELAGVDEAAGTVYFVSTQGSPLERHLYRVNLDGSGRSRITQAPGTHAISMAPRSEYYLDTFSNLASPPARTLFKADGSQWAVFVAADHGPLEEYDIRPTEVVEVRADDKTVLYARLIRPAGFRTGVKYPAVVFVYGGPHAQQVRNRWAGLTIEQALAHRGFVIWELDNRGSGGRGHLWESALYRGFGAKELEDQQAGVRRLISMGFVAPGRLGIYGWSYGGYMTLYALLNAPDLFRAGVAGAPVVDWRNYDTIYTERYLGLPSENAEAYRRSSPVNDARNLKANLLIIHNLEDDNVLFQNTLQMADALERAGKAFDLAIYPQKTHAVTSPAREHMLDSVAAFFERHLKAAPKQHPARPSPDLSVP
jgi:dipeptidyl-peptidase-4